jgi:hypothetical protein
VRIAIVPTRTSPYQTCQHSSGASRERRRVSSGMGYQSATAPPEQYHYQLGPWAPPVHMIKLTSLAHRRALIGSGSPAAHR